MKSKTRKTLKIIYDLTSMFLEYLKCVSVFYITAGLATIVNQTMTVKPFAFNMIIIGLLYLSFKRYFHKLWDFILYDKNKGDL